MKIDLYTKFLLTIITGALVVIAMASVRNAGMSEDIASVISKFRSSSCGRDQFNPCHIKMDGR